MNLTDRTTKYLNAQKYRSDAVKSMDIIELAFSEIGIQLTQELIDFQMNFGGLMMKQCGIGCLSHVASKSV